MVYNTCLGHIIFTIGLPAECDVLELQKQAKLKDDIVFSAQGGPIF